METSINVGKRDQLRQNLRGFTDELVYLLLILEDYERFVDEVSGMTDEEYAAKMAQENSKEETKETDTDMDVQEEVPEDLTVISIAALDEIAKHAKSGDFEQVRIQLDRLKNFGYDGDNFEFLQALSEAATSGNADMITELVNTYRDLKL